MNKYELFSEDEDFNGPSIWEENALMDFLKSLETLPGDHECFANSMDSYEKAENVRVDWNKKTVYLEGAGGMDIGAAFGWREYEEPEVITEFLGIDELAWCCDEYVSIEIKEKG